MFTRICALEGCGVEFQTDNSRKMHCCATHTNRAKVRRWKKNRRKKRGGGGDDGPGGGLRATYCGSVELPSASDKDRNRYSVNSPKRKPSTGVTSTPQKQAYKAAA